jgi:hypothetical protein
MTVKHFINILQIFLISLPDILICQPKARDFLPLAIGNRWSYTNNSVDFWAVEAATRIDSGEVQYLITSSIVTKDSTIWQWKEIYNVKESFYPYYGQNTSSWIKDTNTFELIEYADGNHRIKRTEPWYFSPNSIFLLPEDANDSSVVFRYSPAAAADTFTVQGAANGYNFSMLFQEGIGVTRSSCTNDKNWLGGSYISKHELKESVLMSVSPRSDQKIISTLDIIGNYPNPFNPSTTITFTIKRKQHITVRIFNYLAREVVVLLDQAVSAGTHNIFWNASHLSSGVYLCSVQSGSSTKTIKLLLLK